MPNVLGWLGLPPSEGSLDGLLQSNHAANTQFRDQAGGLFQTDGKISRFDDYLIAYSGQLRWNLNEFKSIAQAEGHEKAILKAYRMYDKGFLRFLSGQFLVAILNPSQKRALIAIDRMGIQRLAYSDINGLVFSDSVECLKKYSDPTPKLSQQALYDYVYFHMIPSPGSIYQGINKLGPAQYLEYRDGNIVIDTYWKPAFIDDSIQSANELAIELRQTLSVAVENSIHDGNTGAFLSGGLDSSSVAGYLAELSDKPARTYTIGFDAKGYDETEYAKIASDHFGTVPTEYVVTPVDVLDAIPRIVAAYDEPFGNSSAIPTFYCAKRAKQDGIELLLAGDGGDELFAGNERYATQKLFEAYTYLPSIVKQGIEGVVGTLPGFDTLPVLKQVNSYIRQSNTPLPDRLENYNFLHQHNIEEVFDPSFLRQVDGDAPASHLRNYFGQVNPASNLNKMLYLDWKRTLADNDLRKVNEMCSLAGVKVAYPMLDDRLVELSCRIPGNLKLKGRKLRYFYKFALKDFLPDRILNKSKHGFGLPFGVWTQTHPELQDFAYTQVNKLKHRGFFKNTFLDRSIQLHQTGHAAYYGELIWILMMLESWLAHHCDQN